MDGSVLELTLLKGTDSGVCLHTSWHVSTYIAHVYTLSGTPVQRPVPVLKQALLCLVSYTVTCQIQNRDVQQLPTC